jgi:hypothetical protein
MVFCSDLMTLDEISNLKGENECRRSFITRSNSLIHYRICIILDYPRIKETDLVIVRFKYMNKYKDIKFYPSIRKRINPTVFIYGENSSICGNFSVANSFLTMDWEEYYKTFTYEYIPDPGFKLERTIWMRA